VRVERFEQSHVEVHARAETRAGNLVTVVAEFRPTESGVHLYGAELPASGIDGAGRPTRLAVVDAAWASSGPLQASQAAVLVPYAGFDEPFPVYPDGPVTLEQPITRVVGQPDDGSIGIRVSFMACTTSGLCYLPVADHSMTVETP
jgi:hypothetical protein